jgi:hypothetical protein
MKEWIKNLFRKLFPVHVEVAYYVVEVEKPRMDEALTEELKASVLTLAGHPGFQYLVGKLKAQRSVLETQLKTARHDDIRTVELLQSGIFWAGWLQTQVEKMTLRVQKPVTRPATPEEQVAYNEARDLISLVGR